MTQFEVEAFEISQLLKYLEYSVSHAGSLLGLVISSSLDDKDSEIFKPLSTLNKDALAELKALVKRISSKADSLQNKVDLLKLD